MVERYGKPISIKFTSTERAALESIPGNRSAFIRSCVREGIRYYRIRIQKLNSEEIDSDGTAPEAPAPAGAQSA